MGPGSGPEVRRIAVIPGDGIGVEVTEAARQVLDAVARRHRIALAYDEFDWSCQRYLTEGAMMPADGLDRRTRSCSARWAGPAYRTMSRCGGC
jgi:tartrate dehydrogenase/decarboxylase/D-malate dehydrogenase